MIDLLFRVAREFGVIRQNRFVLLADLDTVIACHFTNPFGAPLENAHPYYA